MSLISVYICKKEKKEGGGGVARAVYYQHI